LPHKYICELIINPRTRRPIDIDTLRKTFELDITTRYSKGPRCRRNVPYDNAVNSKNVAAQI
jgi:hypothetical protein